MTNILFIGAGGISHRHAQCLADLEGVSIVGVCDLDKARAEKLAAVAGHAATFTDAAHALDATCPDYAAILTPRTVRAGPIDLCLERAVPFLVEKPPCDCLASGLRMRDRVEASGLLHAVGFMHRWNEALEAALAAVRAERISLMTFRFTAPFATKPVFGNYPDPYLVERSGGLVGDQGIHYVDLARHVSASEVAEATGLGANQLLPLSKQVTTRDAVCWTLKMESGALVNHSHTWCGPDWDCRLDLVTDRSRLSVDLFRNAAEGDLAGKTWSFTGSIPETRRMHEGFIHALTTGDRSTIRSTYADAMQSFAAAEHVNAILYGADYRA